jgi:DNA-binding GntR family transcriptional regulator
VETRVAREFGTSQAPVREALRDLEGLGVVETSPFRGARVRRPTTEELLEAFDVRAILESHGAILAMSRMTESDLDKLSGHIEQMRLAAVAGDPYSEAASDTEFHRHIMQRSGNATLERVWRTLEPFLRTYITIVSPGVDRRAVADRHLPIVAALRLKEPAAVEAAFREHFEAAAASLAEVWPHRGGVPHDDIESSGPDDIRAIPI